MSPSGIPTSSDKIHPQKGMIIKKVTIPTGRLRTMDAFNRAWPCSSMTWIFMKYLPSDCPWKARIGKPSATIEYKKPKTEPIITEKIVKKEIEPVKIEPKKEEVTIAEKPVINTTNGVVIYKVQISATDRKFDLKPEFFKGLDKISVTFDQKLYRYYYEETTEYPKAQKYLEITRKKGYTSAFIVPFKNGEKITFQEAFNQK